MGAQVNIEKAMAAHDASADTSCRATSTASARSSRCAPATSGACCASPCPPTSRPLVVDKGSISVDGTSLTVSAVSAADEAAPWFEISLIPETLAATTLGARAVGDRVNLETDILARHVERLLASSPTAAAVTDEGGSR